MADQKQDHEFRSAVASLEIPTSREDLRGVFLDDYKTHFEQDTTNPLPAFDALVSVVSYWWSNNEEPTNGYVEVPW